MGDVAVGADGRAASDYCRGCYRTRPIILVSSVSIRENEERTEINRHPFLNKLALDENRSDPNRLACFHPALEEKPTSRRSLCCTHSSSAQQNDEKERRT